MMTKNIENHRWTAECYDHENWRSEEKRLVPELCYSLYVNGVLYEEIFCAPWHLEALVYGRLYMRGAIQSAAEVLDVQVQHQARRIEVRLAGEVRARKTLSELFGAVPRFTAPQAAPVQTPQDTKIAAAPAGGDCRASGGQAAPQNTKIAPPAGLSGASELATPAPAQLSAEDVIRLAAALDQASRRFRLTGGVHSAAIAQGSDLLWMMEDIGRHNAMDKLKGICLMNKVNTLDKVIVFSGRVAAEILQKAALIGCPVIIAMSAPSDLACRLAEEKGMTLIGFARGERFNIYTGHERIRR